MVITQFHLQCISNFQIPDLINKRTKCGHTPLWVASYMGRLSVVEYLLEKAGADATIPSSHQNRTDGNTLLTTGLASTPLIIACQQGQLKVLRYLISKHANLNDTRTDGENCLSVACHNGHFDIVEYTLGKKPELVHHKNYAGQSPLWLAANYGSREIVESLFEHEADIESASNESDTIMPGRTPLFISCQGKY